MKFETHRKSSPEIVAKRSPSKAPQDKKLGLTSVSVSPGFRNGDKRMWAPKLLHIDRTDRIDKLNLTGRRILNQQRFTLISIQFLKNYKKPNLFSVIEKTSIIAFCLDGHTLSHGDEFIF